MGVENSALGRAGACPMDCRLPEIARHEVAAAAKRVGVPPEQASPLEGKVLCLEAGGYGHGKQIWRPREVRRRRRPILSVVIRETQRVRQGQGDGASIGAVSFRT